MVMYNAFSHSHSTFIYSYYFEEEKVTESRYTGQDAYMRSFAAAEDLKCLSNVLAVLLHCSISASPSISRTGIGIQHIPVQSWVFKLLPLRKIESAGKL